MNKDDENKKLGFGVLVRDNKHDWCKGTVSLPSLSKCQIRFCVCWDGEIFEEDVQQEPTDVVPITVFNSTDCTASEAQNAACLSFMENQSEVASAVLQVLSAVSERNVKEIRESLHDAESLRTFDDVVAKNQLASLDGVKKQVELLEVGFLEQEKEGHAYVSLDFNCGWDEEHGISVLTHKNQVVAVSGCADFYHRAEGLEAHIQILQGLL